MPKASTVLIMALLGIVGVQSWYLYRSEEPKGSTSGASASTVAAEQSAPVAAQHADTERLARMEARLSMLETAKSTAPAPQQQNIILGSPEAMAADRKIASLLPKGPMTQQDLFLMQSQLAQYPSNERTQLLAALARAINDGRVQIAPGP